MQRIQSRVTGLLTRRTAIVALALLIVGGTAAALLAAEPLRPKSRRPAAASAATSPPSIIVDAATARAMEARGEIRPIGRDGSGQPVYALVMNGGATVVLIGPTIANPGGSIAVSRPAPPEIDQPPLVIPDWFRRDMHPRDAERIWPDYQKELLRVFNKGKCIDDNRAKKLWEGIGQPVDKEKFKRFLPSWAIPHDIPHLVDNIFDDYDKNDDGKLDLEEFKKFLKDSGLMC